MGSGGWRAGADRRRAERVEVNLRARWRGERARRAATVSDLSATGCFVLTDDLVRAGERVLLELELPRSGHLALSGRVVYKVAEIGFALEFDPCGEEDGKRLAWLIRAEARRKGLQGSPGGAES